MLLSFHADRDVVFRRNVVLRATHVCTHTRDFYEDEFWIYSERSFYANEFFSVAQRELGPAGPSDQDDPLPLAAHDSNFDPLYLSRLLPNSFVLLSHACPPRYPVSGKFSMVSDATKRLAGQLYPLSSRDNRQPLITWLITALVALIFARRKYPRGSTAMSSYHRRRWTVRLNNLVSFSRGGRATVGCTISRVARFKSLYFMYMYTRVRQIYAVRSVSSRNLPTLAKQFVVSSAARELILLLRFVD